MADFTPLLGVISVLVAMGIPIALLLAYADKLIEGSILVPLDVAVERFHQDENIPEASVERLKQWHKDFSVCLE